MNRRSSESYARARNNRELVKDKNGQVQATHFLPRHVVERKTAEVCYKTHLIGRVGIDRQQQRSVVSDTCSWYY